jgi:antitoxin component of MazEF toxin-antitoxin module
METNIIKIGNSRGLIIPKRLLSHLNSEKVLIEKNDQGYLVIKPTPSPREGWEDVMIKAINDGDIPESDLFEEMSNDFDKEEWTW